MTSRTFSSSGYRYGFNGQEKDDEISGTGNSYTAEFWEYDARIGRRWNIDPIPKIPESPYATFANNPVMLVDLNGADTAVVNSAGKVIYKAIDKNNTVLFHNNGRADDDLSQLRQIDLNDPKMDGMQVNESEIGDQLVNFVDYDQVNYIFNKQGIDNAAGRLPGVNWVKTALQSRGGSLDFGYTYLRARIFEYNQIYGNIPGLKGVTMEDQYSVWDNVGGLFVFTGQYFDGKLIKRAYNLPDAGNFLFGAATARLNISWPIVKLGTFGDDSSDPTADKTAIQMGYMYHKDIVSSHFRTHLFPSLESFDTKKPGFDVRGIYEYLIKWNKITDQTGGSRR